MEKPIQGHALSPGKKNTARQVNTRYLGDLDVGICQSLRT